MRWIKSFWQQCDQIARDFEWRPIDLLLVAIAFTLFVVQFTQLNYYVAQAAGTRPEVWAVDNDAGNAIDVVERTRWYKSNSFHAYGPTYFRLAHTYQAFATPETGTLTITPEEAISQTAHLGLLTVSLLALMGLGYFLASLITPDRPTAMIASTLFTHALLFSETWRDFLLRAHPDILLSFFVAIATWATFRAWEYPEEKRWYYVSAWAWGLALTTKLSVILFLPFVGIWYLWPLSRASVKAAFFYALQVVFAFFVLGFPQNFSLERIFKFLKFQSQFSGPPNLDSIVDWFTLWSEQILAPFLLALVLIAFGINFRHFFTRTRPTFIGRALVLGFGPFVLMLAQNINAPHAHYPMPLIAAQITLLLLLATRLVVHPTEAFNRRNRKIVFTAAAVVLTVLCGVFPNELRATLMEKLTCRSEARAVYKKIHNYQVDGKKIFIDPYVPSMEGMENVHLSWKVTKDLVASEKFDVLVLKGGHYAIYFAEPVNTSYISTYNPHWELTRSFYELFREQESTHDPQIGSWKRVDKDSCTWEIWERHGP